MRLIVDTCWFIDLEKQRSSAIEFLRNNPSATFVLTEIVRGELFAGGRDFEQVSQLVESSDRPTFSPDVSRIWGQVARDLRSRGLMIGANDLWIASMAVSLGIPVLTRNADEFSRVPDLQIVTY